MDKRQLRECTLDVERLRKAADRLDMLDADYRDIDAKLQLATQSLKMISVWADNARYDAERTKTLADIHNRAMDTLKLIGEIKGD